MNVSYNQDNINVLIDFIERDNELKMLAYKSDWEGLFRVLESKLLSCGITTLEGRRLFRIGTSFGFLYLFFKAVDDFDILTICYDIPEEAFSGELGLTKIDIPGNIKGIGEDAFRDCLNLVSARLPEGILYVNERTFQNCNKLSYLYIPASVTHIFGNAAAYCTNLKEIYFGGTQKQWRLIKKATFWDAFTPIAIIHCSDGDLTYISPIKQ